MKGRYLLNKIWVREMTNLQMISLPDQAARVHIAIASNKKFVVVTCPFSGPGQTAIITRSRSAMG
jgi:hypothetical protein